MGKKTELRPAHLVTLGRFRMGAPPTAPCAPLGPHPRVASLPAPSAKVERFLRIQVRQSAKNARLGRLLRLQDQPNVTIALQVAPRAVLVAMAATNVREGGILAMLQRLAVKVVRPEGPLLIQAQRNVRIVHQAAPKADPGNMSA